MTLTQMIRTSMSGSSECLRGDVDVLVNPGGGQG